MKKLMTVSLALTLALAVVPALAGEKEAKEVQMTGWITDEWCGAKNANADGAGCAKACAKKGAALALFVDGEMYKLSDKEKALKHVGYKVTVKGTMGDEKVINVTSIEKAKEDA